VPIAPDEEQSFGNARKVALLVGVASYPSRSGIGSLKYPADDVDLLRVELEKQAYTVVVLKDSEATREAIRNSLRDVARVMRGSGTFVFYFSGHGWAPLRRNILATFDAGAANLEGSGLPVDEVLELMEASGAQRRILWLDACRNEPGKSAPGTRVFSELAKAQGTRILFSTRAGSISYERDDLRHGVFSYFLVEALRGAAAREDGLITFGDVAGYVTIRVEDFGLKNGSLQSPYEAGEARGDFLLARIARESAASPPPAPVRLPRTGQPLLDALVEKAERGDRSALPEIAERYETGRGVPVNYAESLRWYRQAMEAGDPRGFGGLGAAYANGLGTAQSYPESVRFWTAGAGLGDSRSTRGMAIAYQFGHGVPKDAARSREWYSRAGEPMRRDAQSGNPNAAYFLGLMHQDGGGAVKNAAEAVRWLRQAAEAGHAPAMLALGSCYERADGVAKNLKETERWYRKAAETGYPDGMASVGSLYQQGLGVERNLAEAERWFKSAAERGSSVGMAWLGSIAESGPGKDLNASVNWYTKAAEKGESFSMFRLGLLYETGTGVPKNIAQSMKWLRKAADEGHMEAIVKLGNSYANGVNVARDPVEAARWFQLAADAGDPAGMKGLTLLSERKDLLARLNARIDGAQFDSESTTIDATELSFYPGYRLISVSSTKLPGTQKFAVYNGSLFYLLDYSNQPIYSANPAALKLNKDNVAAYIRFFFKYVRGRHGRFLLVDNAAEVAWQKDVSATVKDNAAKVIRPVQLERIGDDGTYYLRAWMVFKHDLYSSAVTVAPDGLVKLTDEKLLLENLPVEEDTAGLPAAK
jgi:TPR repeat protein